MTTKIKTPFDIQIVWENPGWKVKVSFKKEYFGILKGVPETYIKEKVTIKLLGEWFDHHDRKLKSPIELSTIKGMHFFQSAIQNSFQDTLKLAEHIASSDFTVVESYLHRIQKQFALDSLTALKFNEANSIPDELAQDFLRSVRESTLEQILKLTWYYRDLAKVNLPISKYETRNIEDLIEGLEKVLPQEEEEPQEEEDSQEEVLTTTTEEESKNGTNNLE